MADTTITALHAEPESLASGGRRMVLNMGPQHPSTHGVLRLLIELDGETVVKCQPDIGYLHTGIEKEFEVKTYQQGVTLTDRTGSRCSAIGRPFRSTRSRAPAKAQSMRACCGKPV